MKKLIALLLIATTIVACQPKERMFVENKELSPDVEWLKKDTREFKVPISDNSKPYNFSLTFRFANGFQYKTTKIKVTETSPCGKVTIKDYELKIIDEKGEYIGEAGYDIWDSEHLVEPKKMFEEKGTYTYVIEHNMPIDPLNYAMEIGIVIDEIK